MKARVAKHHRLCRKRDCGHLGLQMSHCYSFWISLPDGATFTVLKGVLALIIT